MDSSACSRRLRICSYMRLDTLRKYRCFKIVEAFAAFLKTLFSVDEICRLDLLIVS